MNEQIRVDVVPHEYSYLQYVGGKFRLWKWSNKYSVGGYARLDGTFTPIKDMFDKQNLAEAVQFDTHQQAFAWGEARGWNIITNREHLQEQYDKLAREEEMKRTGTVSTSGRVGSVIFGIVLIIGGLLVTGAAFSGQGRTSLAALLAGPIATLAGIGLVWRGITGKDKPADQ